MYVCRICHFQITLDDIALKFTSGMVICVRCFARETHTDRPMPAAVKRDATRTVNEAQ